MNIDEDDSTPPVPKDIVSTDSASYALIVSEPDEDGRCRCTVDLSFAIGGGKETIRFLRAVARWFEDTKQDFLRSPTIQNYVQSEIPGCCLGTQDVFIKAVCNHTNIPATGAYTLTRQKHGIWFFWDSYCLALNRLFDKDIHQACVAKCRRIAAEE